MKEMVGGCCVCADESGWTENPLVYCDGQGCNVAVHQACYGIVRVPIGPWFCRKCESQEKSAKVKCELCPSGDGALKKTDNSGWAHVVCALYIPEVRFGNVTAMEPIILQLIPQERYNKSCYLCEEQGKQAKAAIGACMQCNKTGCKQNFHVTCAQAAGLLCEEAGNYSDNVKYTGYCLHHYQKLKKTSSIKTVPAFKPLPSAMPDLTSEKSKNRTEINGQSTSSSIAGSSSPDSKSKMNDSTDSVITHTSNLLQSDSRKRRRSKSESTSSSSTEPSSELGDGSSAYNTNTSDVKDSSLTANLEGYSASNNLPNGVTAKKIRLSDENNKKKQKKILRKAKTDNGLREKKNHKRGGLNIQMVENTHVSEDYSKPPVLKIQMETNATKTKRHMNFDHHSVASTSSTSVHGLVGPSLPRARRNSCRHPKFPQTLEQLLEHHWEQGSQFMMEQSQNFDVASLLSCLHQLRQENTCLEDHVNNLASRRDHLLAVNARLSVPLAHSYKQQKL